MNKTKSHLVGMIAEDDSDVETLKVLIHRITNNDTIGIKKFVGRGCGKIKRKANMWANNLKEKGCHYLILVHDLDKNDIEGLKKKLNNAINPCPIEKYLICIPIQELETWLLSDPDALQIALHLNKLPKIRGFTYNIDSPKEFLGSIIYKASDGEKIYLNTKHNVIISKQLSIDKIKKNNPSFIPFYDFVTNNILQTPCK